MPNDDMTAVPDRRVAGEHLAASELARNQAEAMDAMRATSANLHATLENMKVVEEMRRTLRDIRERQPPTTG